MIVAMIEPRLKSVLEMKIILHLPDSLKQLKTFDEILLHYRTHTNSKDLRKLFRAVAVMVWNNQIGGLIEAQIMDILKIAYKQELVGSNAPLAIHRKFGHIARLVIRVKGSHVIDPFRFVFVFSLLQLLLLFLWILTHWFPSPTAMLLFAFTGKFSIHEE